MLKRLSLYLLIGFALLVMVVLYRTFQFKPELSAPTEQAQLPHGAPIAQRLAAAIQFQTISLNQMTRDDYLAFNHFTQWLEQTYPAVFDQLGSQVINQYSRLLHWRGSEPQHPAILLSAHYDVVPVIPGTENQWQHPPFAGVIADGYVWGRGALDNKSAVIALMESVDGLLAQGFQPKGDIYIALTHDEEIGSQQGARTITQWLKERDVNLAWSLDEGSFVLNGMVPGVEQEVASINVAEKGFLNLKLIAHSQGGHSSMPPQETAVSILAQALVRLRQTQVAGGLSGVSEAMYAKLSKHMDFTKRLLFANSWLFKPLLEHLLSSSPTTNATLRTTVAPTMLSGSVKANVLPITATATINFRLHPRDKVESIVTWVEEVIQDDRISLQVLRSFEASRISDSAQQGFQRLAEQARKTHGDVVVTPGLTIAATDSRYYNEITEAYRFNPMVINKSDLAGFHGTNERISIENMAKAVHFYSGLMQQQ